MTTSVIGGGVYLPPGHSSINDIRNRFKIRNPDYGQALALREKGRWVELPDEWIYACEPLPPGHPWQGGLAIPRGLKGRIGDIGHIQDMQGYAPAEKLSLGDGFQTRGYQQEAVEALKKHHSGIVVAPCGSGKTCIGILAIAAIPTKTLVLVHTLDLAKQWIDRCESMLGITPSLVGGGSFNDDGRVVVATFQTLSRHRWDERYQWAKKFGMIIADEVHHVPSRTFRDVMMTMPAKYRLGLTATPERPDGLTELMWWHFGTKLLELKQSDMVDAGLVLSPSIEWLNTLCQMNGFGIPAAALVGSLSKKKRAELLKDADDRKLLVITATTIADEGLDLPKLDTVVLTTPTKAMGRVQQRIGRVMRRFPGKRKPLVIDCIDDVGALKGLARKRFKLYNAMGCT